MSYCKCFTVLENEKEVSVCCYNTCSKSASNDFVPRNPLFSPQGNRIYCNVLG